MSVCLVFSQRHLSSVLDFCQHFLIKQLQGHVPELGAQRLPRQGMPGGIGPRPTSWEGVRLPGPGLAPSLWAAHREGFSVAWGFGLVLLTFPRLIVCGLNCVSL